MAAIKLNGDTSGHVEITAPAVAGTQSVEFPTDVVQKSEFQSEFQSEMAALAWTAYTPTWAANTGSPTIGNGTLTGKYVQIGKLLHFKIALTFGSTTSVGTSTVWRFGLPVPVVYDNMPVPGWLLDSGTAEYLATATVSAATEVRPTVSTGYLSYNAPFTWTTNDCLRIQGTLEVV